MRDVASRQGRPPNSQTRRNSLSEKLVARVSENNTSRIDTCDVSSRLRARNSTRAMYEAIDGAVMYFNETY